jgi:transcriptional regulator GlxA family with amidase domain
MRQMPDHAPGHAALAQVVGRCQRVAGAVLDDDPRRLRASLRQLTFGATPHLSAIERVLVRHVVGQTLARAAARAGIDHRPDVIDAFLTWQRADASSGALFDEVNQLAETCAAALDAVIAERDRDRLTEPRVCYVLDVLAKHFRDPRLSLKKAAAGTGLSVWHATRLVKKYTGVSFTQHLHRVRIRAARDLLQTSRLTVKEIAYSVGYSSSTQFGRHFKQIAGTNPMTFRRRIGSEPTPRQESPTNSKD